jgi:ADP-ribose pyrophosphatase YjhB (NUDIX family)
VGELDGWQHCPRCTSDLRSEPGAVRCDTCGLVVYAKPAPAICGLVVDDGGRVLLGRRAHEPAAGRWDLLGGFMTEDEQPRDTLKRELREETGLDVEPEEFVGVVADRYGDEGNATLNLCWTARIVSGDAAPSDDVSELRWFEPDELPGEEELAFPNTAALLRAWRTPS